MKEADIAARVKDRFGARVLNHYEFRGQHALTIAPETLRELATFLRDDADLAFDMLSDVGGVDLLNLGDEDREWRFEVVYHFWSIAKNHRIRVKVAVRDESVAVPTLSDLWGLANWEEREVYDMFGVHFHGHPNLRRILCHDEFVGHALRKDYPINRRQKLSHPAENILCARSEDA